MPWIRGAFFFLLILLAGCAHPVKSRYPVVTDQAPRRLPPVPARNYFDGSLFRPDGMADLASDQKARFRGETLWIRIPAKNGLPGFPQDQESLIGGVVVRVSQPDELVIFARKTVRKGSAVRRWILTGRIRREDIGFDNTVSVNKLSMARYRFDQKEGGQEKRFKKNLNLPPLATGAAGSANRSNRKTAGQATKKNQGPPPIQGGGS